MSEISSNSINTASNTFTSSNNYFVTVTDANNCSATANKIVTVNQPPNNGVATSGNTIFCTGGSDTLTAQGSGTYLWSNGSANQSITVNQSGNYIVTVTSINNCSASSNSINVTVNQPSPAIITPQSSTTFCQGGSVALQASAGNSYNWSNGATTQSITVAQGNTYTVTVTDANNCSATATQSVTVNPNPTVTFSLPNIICNTSNSFAMNGNPSGGTYTGAGVSGNSFNASNAGLGLKQVNYTFTNGNGCSGSASSTTLVYDTAGVVCTSYDTVTTIINDTVTTYLSVNDTLKINVNLTGVTQLNNTNLLTVYPNPAKDHLLVNHGNYTSMNGYTVKITNTLGQIVFNQPVNQQQFYIDLSTWGGAGTYILYITDQNQTVKTQKQIVLQ